MQLIQIMSGFSDIKRQLRMKTQIEKEPWEFELWFTLEDGFLCVHDRHNHNLQLVMAVYSPEAQRWKTFLEMGSFGARLLLYAIEKFRAHEIHDELNELYELAGLRI
jgi:hypothetical protein